MKRKISLLIAALLLASIAGCGATKDTTETACSSVAALSVKELQTESKENESVSYASSSAEEDQPESVVESNVISDSASEVLEAIGDIEVDKGLLTVSMTIPSDFVGDTTQEELDQMAAEQEIDSIVLNEDGSATYTMSKAKQKEILDETKKYTQESLNELCGSEDLPSIESVSFNDDLTAFTVNIDASSDSEIGLNESFFVYLLYLYSGMYHSFAGDSVDNVQVDYISTTTGETIMTLNSSDLEE